MANPQTGGAQLVAQDGIKLPVSLNTRPAGNIGLSDRGFLFLLDATTAAFTAKLPDPTIVVGQPICIKKTDSSANAITISQNGSETIDGATTAILTQQYESITVISDGTNWQVIEQVGATFDTLALKAGVTTSGTPQIPLTVAGAAWTGATLSTEVTEVAINLAQTKQFATGAITNQRAVLISAPTYSFVGSSTITNAATVAISGAPIQGTNATITNGFDLWCMGGSIAIGNNSSVINTWISSVAAVNGVLSLGLNLSGTLTGSPADFFMNTFTTVLAGAFTVTRLDLFQVKNPTGAATITDMCVFSFDANGGTHKGLDAGTTKTTPGTVNNWIKINANGTVNFIPCYTSKTS